MSGVRRSPVCQALFAELARVGVSDVWVEHGSKHPRVCYVAGDVQRYLVFPGTTSRERTAGREAVRRLRHQLAEVGVAT